MYCPHCGKKVIENLRPNFCSSCVKGLQELELASEWVQAWQSAGYMVPKK